MRDFNPHKDSENFEERNAAYALEAGDTEAAAEYEAEFYRVGTEDDCCHEYAG